MSGRKSRRGTLWRSLSACAVRLKRKILLDRLSPERVALGWAIGMFYGCVVPFGFQLILSVPTAVFLRASKVGATVGTLITNPVTIFFIYPAQCYAANRLIGGNFSYDAVSKAMDRVISAGDYQTLFSLGGELVLSFFIGGFLFAAFWVPVTYFTVKRIIVNNRSKKERKNAVAN